MAPGGNRGGRGAFQQGRRRAVRHAGPAGKENVGMSNDKTGEKPVRRKAKGSSIDVNQIRVSRGLRRSRKAKLMENWLIFQYLHTLKRGRSCGLRAC